jgi:hypothetical protein
MLDWLALLCNKEFVLGKLEVADFTLSSLIVNTGSAKIATVLGAGLRPVNSRRNTSMVEAEGKLTISCSTNKGVLLSFGTGKAANGTYCNAPSPTITKRFLLICSATGFKRISLKLVAVLAKFCLFKERLSLTN